MSFTSETPSVGSLSRLLQIADETITAGDLVRDQRLFTVRPSEPIERARSELDRRGFTWAPVTDIPISRFVSTTALTRTGARVEDVSEPITDVMRIDEASPLSSALERLREHPVVFVQHHRHATGVLTVADLEQPVVSLLLFGLITSAEAALDLIIDRQSSGRWFECLSETQQTGVLDVYEARRRFDAELSMVRCLDLTKRLTLVTKLGLASQLGFASNGQFRAWKRRVIHVRNVLAHGDTLLTAVPDPANALDTVVELRQFATRAWEAATDERELLRAFARTVIRTVSDPPIPIVGADVTQALPVAEPAFVITAENPGGNRAPENQNSRRTNKLGEELRQRGVPGVPVMAGAEDWFEFSYLVSEADIRLDDILQLARDFGQHSVFRITDSEVAIVHAEDGSITTTQPRRRLNED